MASAIVARRLWIVYVGLTTPVGLFAVALGSLLLFGTLVEDVGPIESPLPSTWEKVVAYIAIIGVPIAWLFGVLFAHRFDRPHRRWIPWFAQWIPISAATCVAVLTDLDEPGHLSWGSLYMGIIQFVLITGSATISVHDHAASAPLPAHRVEESIDDASCQHRDGEKPKCQRLLTPTTRDRRG